MQISALRQVADLVTEAADVLTVRHDGDVSPRWFDGSSAAGFKTSCGLEAPRERGVAAAGARGADGCCERPP